MGGVDSERRMSRKKRKLSTRQGVVIGVATVAGVGLMAKLFSFLRREPKPKELDAAELKTLEAVLSGDAAKSQLPAESTHKFANLEADDDEPQQQTERKEADTASPEAAPEIDTTTKDVESHTKETPHFNGEANGVKDHSEPEDERKHQNGDVVELRTEGEEEKVEEVEPKSEDAAKSSREGEVKQLIEEAIEPQLENRKDLDSEEAAADEEATETPSQQDAQEAHNAEDVALDREDRDAVELQVEDAEDLPSKEGEKQQVNEDAEEAPSVEEEKLNPKDEDVTELPLEDVKELPSKEEEKHSNENGDGDAVVLQVADAEEVSSKESKVNHVNQEVEEAESAKEVKQANGNAFELPIVGGEQLPEGKLLSEDATEAPIQPDAQKLTAPDAVEPQMKELPIEDAEKPQTL